MKYIAILLSLSWTVGAQAAAPGSKDGYTGAGCSAPVDDFFVNELWAKVGSQTCIECHKAGGDAEDSKLVLVDLARIPTGERDAALRQNRNQFQQIARVKADDGYRLVLKATGQVKHGGKQAIKPESAAAKVLAEYVRRVNGPTSAEVADAIAAARNAPPFYDGVVMIDDERLLRRLTLSLAGRLPTDAEIASIRAGSKAAGGTEGGRAIFPILDGVMTEDAFYTRLREAFNDIFLTLGYDGNAEDAFSYDHFSTTRHWYQKFDLSSAGDAKAQTQARYKLSGDYRKAILGEPMKLIEHIVRNDRPFSEIITADYIMVTPYSARGYGVYEQIKDQFKNPDDPFEYVPLRLKALIGRNKADNQDSATGFYPHAGILSTFQYLKRYPTTETNRNRLRSRMYYQHFLGVDVLELAARVSDAAAVTAKFEVPTMQASECAICHKTLDPVAGLFQDYWRFEGVYGKRKGGWFTDMFGPGFEGEDLPPAERWRSLQWLGERTVKDPRFAVAMVEHAYYLMTGRRPLLPPKDVDDPLFGARRRAYEAQRSQIEASATRFAKNNFNFKQVIKELAVTDFYRADGVATAELKPERRMELDDLGVVRMLSPEQLERKVGAVFGRPWGRLNEQMAMLYGGIDSKEVTERASDPSGAMGAIQRIMANDVACRNVALDFSRPPERRLLFPAIEPDVVPGTPEGDQSIRATIVHLHRRILGRDDTADSPEVERTYQLFAGIVADAAAKEKGFEKQETYSCRQNLEKPVPDPKYTVRAWRAVVTYLLRRPEFLYE